MFVGCAWCVVVFVSLVVCLVVRLFVCVFFECGRLVTFVYYVVCVILCCCLWVFVMCCVLVVVCVFGLSWFLCSFALCVCSLCLPCGCLFHRFCLFGAVVCFVRWCVLFGISFVVVCSGVLLCLVLVVLVCCCLF